MRKPVLLIFVNACILILIFVLLGQSLFVVQRVAFARSVSGQVQVQRGGKGAFMPLGNGGAVHTGDVVETGAASWAELGWKDGTRWKLWPHSRFSIAQAQLNPAKSREISQFQLEQGQILVRVVRPLSGASRFEVETPSALTEVRGTIFRVAVDKNVTEVAVYQGHVDVSNKLRAEYAPEAAVPEGAVPEATAPETTVSGEAPQSAKMTLIAGQKARVSMLGTEISAHPDAAEFLAHPEFLKPDLQVRTNLVAPNAVLLLGQTEAGDAVTVDGAPVPVLGTGDFVQRVKLSAQTKGWRVESTDKYGVKSSVFQIPPAICH